MSNPALESAVIEPAPDGITGDLPLPTPLFIAHAVKADRAWHRLCWAIDDRMARTVLGAREGAVAAIRLAWWEEALSGEREVPGGEPLLNRWHASGIGPDDRAAVKTIAAAWRMLLDPEPMSESDWHDFGQGRAALFALIARQDHGGYSERAAEVWALWDLSRRDADRSRAEGAFAAAIEAAMVPGEMMVRIEPKPLALAAAMALDDVRARNIPDGRFTPRQYIRMLGRALVL